MSTRSQIVAALESALTDGITSVSSRVYRWRKAPFATQELPAVNYLDGKATLAPGLVGMNTHELPVAIVYAASGKTTASQATAALNEMCAALFEDYSLGGLADTIDLVSHDIMVAQEGDVLGAAQIEIIITYTSPRGTI